MACLAEQPWQDGSCETREFPSFGHQEGGGGAMETTRATGVLQPALEFDPAAGQTGGMRAQQ